MARGVYLQVLRGILKLEVSGSVESPGGLLPYIDYTGMVFKPFTLG